MVINCNQYSRYPLSQFYNHSTHSYHHLLLISIIPFYFGLQSVQKYFKWKSCWVKNITATKSIHYQWKAGFNLPFCRQFPYMDYLPCGWFTDDRWLYSSRVEVKLKFPPDPRPLKLGYWFSSYDQWHSIHKLVPVKNTHWKVYWCEISGENLVLLRLLVHLISFRILPSY